MIGLWGRPKSIQAKSTSYWDVYREAGVENFGQVIADYGDFFAVLASGKQPLQGQASMDVTEALDPRNWHNVLEMQFEHHNLTVLPFHELLIHNGVADLAGGVSRRLCVCDAVPATAAGDRDRPGAR